MTANLALRARPRLFRPSMLSTCLMVALVPLFISLGDWQYGKAQDKIARQAALERRLAGPVLDLADLGPARTGLRQPAAGESAPGGRDAALPDIEYRPVRLHGRWEAAEGFLLDNQVFDGQAGYAAIAPLRLNGGGVVLVNRGWVAAPADHREVPAVAPLASATLPSAERSGAGPAATAATVSVKGLAVALPRPGLQLAGASNAGAVHAFIDASALAARFGAPVAGWMLILDPDAPDALRVQWPQPAERVHTNLGYAWQWFGFAVAAIGIWLWQGWRRAREGGAT
ncbi:MAG: SURF1 family protein [Rhodocyclaceae bacterium]|nr:SURF1 family protein [Rhodocyclaceae bacterium]